MPHVTRVILYQFREDRWSLMSELEQFRRSTGLSGDDLRAVDVFNERPRVRDVVDATALILAGSPLTAFGEVPHRVQLVQCLKLARLTGRAILGVCFGAQFLADIWGGDVVHDKERHEHGTFPVRINARGRRDPLFDGIDDEFAAQCAHHDRIVRPPSDATVLASSARCDIQAFGILGFGIYGVQFHPERSKADYLASLARKREAGSTPAEKLDEIEACLAESPQAERVVRNFIDHHVRPCRVVNA